MNQVSLHIPAGAIAALLGPNGVGKSTILKMLTGLLAPDQGSMEICGRPVPAQFDAVKSLIGVLPESLGLFESLTVAEHLILSGEIYKIPAAETHQRMEDLLAALGLTHGRRTPLNQCSYGMRKKTAFALALIHNPRVLFLDEPFEGLDPISTRAMQGILQSFAARGGAVLLTSHMLPLIDHCASHIWILRDGQVAFDSQASGTSQPLAHTYDELIPHAPLAELQWLRS